MAKRFAVLSVAIVLIFVAYAFIPKREFSIGVFPLRPGESLNVYDDVSDGGSSLAVMNVSDSALDFRCTLGTDSSKDAWCGLIWNFDENSEDHFENWSLVDSIALDVTASVSGEIIVKVWTFDPDVTDKDSLHTFRQMLKEIPLQKGINHVVIPFDELYVPEFWYKQTGAEKDLVQRHKEHVARFEITPGWNAKRGEPMYFRFEKIFVK